MALSAIAVVTTFGVPDAVIDFEKDEWWFNHFECNRLTAGVSYDRHDIPVKLGRNYSEKRRIEISALLPPDERVISKYDRNPFDINGRNDTGICIESCYVYTYAYWIGRYYGFIDEEGQV